MRMRTTLAAAVLCSAALMGPAGIAAADDGDLSGDMSVGNQNMSTPTAQDSDSWDFRSGGDGSSGEHAGGGQTGGDHAGGGQTGGGHAAKGKGGGSHDKS